MPPATLASFLISCCARVCAIAVQINMKRMRKKLVPSPKRCLKVIHGLVPAIASEKHTGFVTVMRDAMRRLTEIPTSLTDLVEYFLVINVCPYGSPGAPTSPWLQRPGSPRRCLLSSAQE